MMLTPQNTRKEIQAAIDAGGVVEFAPGIYESAQKLKDAVVTAKSKTNSCVSAEYYRDHVIPEMNRLRLVADAAEQIMPADMWPLPSYGELTYKQ